MSAVPRDNKTQPIRRSGTAARCTAFTIRIVTLRIDCNPPRTDELLALLTTNEQAKAARFHFAADRNRFIVTRAYLRRLLGEELGTDPRSVALKYGPQGKPFLSGTESEPPHFNVSHSGDIAVIALSRDREIGVDVEALRQLRDADEVALQFFSPRENREYRSVHTSQRVAAFFNCWTRKEALVKAIGEGLNYPLHDFDVSLIPGEPTRLYRLGRRQGENCGWRLESFSPAPGFVAAFATPAGADSPTVHFE